MGPDPSNLSSRLSQYLSHKDNSDSFDFDDFYMFLCGEMLGAVSS